MNRLSYVFLTPFQIHINYITIMQTKSTLAEIKERFDNDVTRFSNLQTGQVSTIDAALSLQLITDAAIKVNPTATHLLDVGCGAGNYTLTLLEKLPLLSCTLNDLSRPMLDRAVMRIAAQHDVKIQTAEGDIRTAPLAENSFDIILAGAVLHHLRDDADWETTFAKLFKLLKPGGSLWIADLIAQDQPGIEQLMQERYAAYLESVGGKTYRQNVMEYIAKEDSPRSVTYQMQLMYKTGFSQVEILHKNICFAAFGGIK